MSKTIWQVHRERAGLQVDDFSGESHLSVCIQIVAEQKTDADVRGDDSKADDRSHDIVFDVPIARAISEQLARLVQQASSEFE